MEAFCFPQLSPFWVPVWVLCPGDGLRCGWQLSGCAENITGICWKPLQMKQYFQPPGVSGPAHKLLMEALADVVSVSGQAKCLAFKSFHSVITG